MKVGFKINFLLLVFFLLFCNSFIIVFCTIRKSLKCIFEILKKN